MRGHETVLVVDFGAQYNQLIARKVREAGVFSRLVSYETPYEELLAYKPSAIILSGGPASVYSPNAPRIDPRIFKTELPILGICYGMQLMSHQLGGRVRRAEKREYGEAYLEILEDSLLFAGIKKGTDVWMSHGDHVISLPVGFKTLARTENTAIAAMGNEERRLYGIQFHSEVTHTEQGQEILQNFLYRIASCKGDWQPASLIEEKVAAVKEQVGNGKAVCGLSGGVDSSVAARLVHEAIGDRLYCIFVDHGLLRQGEAEEVKKTFSEQFDIQLICVDARQRFLKRLVGVVDPEEKRRLIGQEFVAVFEEEAKRISNVRFLVQGTVYPDVIESGHGKSALIKSHHNVGGLPEKMDLELVEPLRDLFKDEVRRLGKALGLPDTLVWRQPFPGPGLAVRIIGEITAKKLEIVRKADVILREELKAAGLERDIWQAFTVLPSNLKSVGVKGDERTYAYPIILRAVNSDDAMTARWVELSYEVLGRISRRITNEIDDVNRVLYDITSKPPGTIEWE